MKKLFLFLALLIFTSGCSAQDNKGKNIDDHKKNEPQTKIIVNKEYDENGNLIRFDSTYSYFYSNIESDSTFGDSAFTIFRDDFFNSFPDIQRPFLDDIFFEDSLLTYDFYKNDFFSKRFKMNWKRFDRLFREMDSIKNEFYQKYSLPKSDKKDKT